jgi:hypothetical protein
MSAVEKIISPAVPHARVEPVANALRDTRLKPQTSLWPAMESEYTDQIAVAFCKARVEYGPVLKTGKSNFGPYAPLDSVYDAVVAANAKHNIFISSSPQTIGDEEYLVTTARHGSGQFVRAMTKIAADPHKPQAYLAYVTYMKRCHVASLCGVAADSDDDGAGATEAATPSAVQSLRLEQMAIQKLNAVATEQDRDEVIARVALRVAKGEMTESQMEKLKGVRESLRGKGGAA